MSERQWTDVDEYLAGLLLAPDGPVDKALGGGAEPNLPPISVAPNQGKLLELLARMHQSRRILEIGTLGGYSAIWLARALPDDGFLMTLELEPVHAKVAAKNLAHAGLLEKVELIVGSALESPPRLADRGEGPFDLVFLDADKVNYSNYFVSIMRMVRPGSAILA